MRVTRMCSTVGICFALMIVPAALYVTDLIPHQALTGSLLLIVVAGGASLFVQRRETAPSQVQTAIRTRAAGVR